MFYFGLTFFGQYAPEAGSTPPEPPAPTPEPSLGGGGSPFFPRPVRHHGIAALIQSPHVLSGVARLIPYALTNRGRNARLLALLE
jgi:hypothetical protein